VGEVLEPEQAKGGLRVVACFEATKGLLVLLAGFGLLAYVHHDLHIAAERLVRNFHLNPASRYPKIFLDLANHLTDGKLWLMAVSAVVYALARFVEAYGLWIERQWAEWFGLITGGMYIPLELFEITRGVTWPKVTLLSVNAMIVAYLFRTIQRSRRILKHAGK
jgi:uncharacterized membrane protein (DUF2068 family)